MSARFLLPCPKCDQKIPVDAKHAGSTRPCSGCSDIIDIPKLRELRQFEVSGGSQNAQPEFQVGGGLPIAGLLFSIGLLILAIGGAVGGYVLYSSNQRYVDVNVEENLQKTEDTIDSASAAELFDSWKTRPEELGNWQEFDFIRRNREASVLRNIAYASFGVAGLGLIMLVSSFCLPAKKNN